MARPKSWLARLPLIIEALDASDAPNFNRAAIEQLFGIRPSAAKELMAVAGTTWLTGGSPPVVTRDNLLFYLRNSPDAQDAMQEIARRKRLAAKLQQANDEARLRAVVLPCTSADEWAQMQDLPNVSIKPGRLTVAFSNPVDLFAQLYRLAKAAGGDWDAFLRVCEQPTLPFSAPDTETSGHVAGLSESEVNRE